MIHAVLHDSTIMSCFIIVSGVIISPIINVGLLCANMARRSIVRTSVTSYVG